MSEDNWFLMDATAEHAVDFVRNLHETATPVEFLERAARIWMMVPQMLEALDVLRKHREHATRGMDVDFSSVLDMARLASLFTHDLALPTSTEGEIALARCVERLVAMLKQRDQDNDDAWDGIGR